MQGGTGTRQVMSTYIGLDTFHTLNTANNCLFINNWMIKSAALLVRPGENRTFALLDIDINGNVK